MQTNIDMHETNKQARRWKAIKDPKEQASFTKKFGLRWSDFRTLPYYNVNRCATTDAMHGLFLTQTSLLMSLFEEFDLIKKSDYTILAEEAAKMILPSGHDTFHRNIAMGFPYMK
ncbi:hypothetical protein, partial, partial [Parasitella parasitica]